MRDGKRPTHEVAMVRFLSGQCPLCGRGKGDSKGIEERIKMEDLFCHSCRRSWTPTTVLRLKHELPVNRAKHPSELAVTVPSVGVKVPSPSFFQRLWKSFAILAGK